MRILVAVDNYDHGTGGAEKSVRSLARGLVRRGHDVVALQHADVRATRDDEGVRVESHPLESPRLLRDTDRDTLRWNRQWRGIVDAHLDAEPADLLLTQQRLLYGSVDSARTHGVPSVAFVRAYGMFCPTQFRDRDPLRDCTLGCSACLDLRQRVAGGALRRNLAAYQQGLRDASLVVANSDYVRRVIRKLLGLDAIVVYPFTEIPDAGRPGAPGDPVLFVKPQFVKGLPIAAAIAEHMPDTRFRVVGHARRRARRAFGRLPNVEMLGWTADMSDVYAGSRVLLGPSIWPEPFGRVFVEAGAAGVPSVASARGGIPEAVGDGGVLIDEIFDVDRWVEALRALEDPSAWDALSKRARAHARRFAVERTLEDFVRHVRERLGLPL